LGNPNLISCSYPNKYRRHATRIVTTTTTAVAIVSTIIVFEKTVSFDMG